MPTTLTSAEAGAVQGTEGDVLVTIHGPRWRLFIIGAGQLSRFVAQVASAMDYHVTVCDPREEYRADWVLPDVTLVHMMPDDLVIESQLDRRSAVLALTHDPKLDDMALIEALKSDAFYVGAIGSRMNNARRRDRLGQFDVDHIQLARLHGPVGPPRVDDVETQAKPDSLAPSKRLPPCDQNAWRTPTAAVFPDAASFRLSYIART